MFFHATSGPGRGLAKSSSIRLDQLKGLQIDRLFLEKLYSFILFGSTVYRWLQNLNMVFTLKAL